MDLQAYRQQRMAMAAEAANVDVLVASLPSNIQYMTEYVSVGQFVLHRTQAYTVFVPAERRTIYVVSIAEIPSVIEHAGETAEIFTFGTFYFHMPTGTALERIIREKSMVAYGSPEEALAAAIQATGKVKVALDESRVTWSSVEKIISLCASVNFSSAEPIFMQARMIKHQAEVAGLERAAEIAAESLDAVVGNYHFSMTELDFEWAYKAEVAKRGGEPYFIVATGDHRSAYVDTRNTPLSVQRLIRFDYGCLYNGYRSDISRTAVIGEPDEKISTYYKAVLAGTRTAIQAIRPGVTAGEIFEIAQRAARENGIPHYTRHHCGHGIGLEAYDLPSIAPGVDIRMEAGMVCCIETPYYEIGWGGVQIENTVEVMETGARYLDKSSDELIVLA